MDASGVGPKHHQQLWLRTTQLHRVPKPNTNETRVHEHGRGSVAGAHGDANNTRPAWWWWGRSGVPEVDVDRGEVPEGGRAGAAACLRRELQLLTHLTPATEPKLRVRLQSASGTIFDR